jgi:phage terminase large subunit-like protein
MNPKTKKRKAKNASSKPADRCTAYAQAVVNGEIVAGPFVRGACQRHLNDLKHAEERGFYYDEHEASEAIAFFEECLCLNGGQFEGLPFILFPWQCFVVGSLFGWKRASDDMRRFRVAFIEAGKGCGKSPMSAALGLKGLCADKEPRAEIYAGATFKEQAMVLFRDAIAFYDQSPELQKRLVASGVGEKRWKLSYPANGSFFRVISSEKKGQSGPRPHIALLDEIHEHRDGTVIEMIRAGFKFRRQPLSFMITNSGHDKTSVCWEYHDMGTKIACEQLENDEFFAYICALDEEDLEDDRYLEDESLWAKVNPSIEYGLPGYDYIRSQVREARGMPSKMSTVKRLCFCIWTEAENPAISREAWMACQDKDYPVDILKDRRAWGGLDLSAVNDLTAFALMFEPGQDDPLWRLKVWFWIPGIGIHRKEETDHVPYIAWRDAGYISAIDRKTIDYEFVITELAELCSAYNVQKIAFDRWKMKDFEKDRDRLGVSLPEMVEFGQGYQSMSPAIKIFETKFTEETMRHDGNPCLTWCASNVVAVEDAAENKKYDKSRSIGRIDGIIAAVMACGILEEGEEKSVYEGMTADEIKARMAF